MEGRVWAQTVFRVHDRLDVGCGAAGFRHRVCCRAREFRASKADTTWNLNLVPMIDKLLELTISMFWG